MYNSDPKLALRDLNAGYSADAVLRGISMDLAGGSITAIVGPNGSGKSSLLKALARKLAVTSGAVLLDGVSLSELSKAKVGETIQLMGALPAARSSETVFELVSKSAQRAERLSRSSPRIKEEVTALLGRTGILALADRPLGELSSGAKQCAQIAAALARDPEILLLDEPTTALDYSHQLEVINLLSSLRRERGMTVIAVFHDLNLAARFADSVVMLKDGEIAAIGDPHEVITPANLATVFHILARVIEDPVGKTPLVVPIRQLD
jgi:iron complex transport system ATP-binding protein